MPPNQPSKTWSAAPHTIAKIEILRAYLLAWFQVFGRSRRGQDLLYVDGFAGPGAYTNYASGSPIAALVAAREVVAQCGVQWIAGDIHFAFIESDLPTITHLAQQVQPFQGDSKSRLHLIHRSFESGLSELRARMPAFFAGSYPLFVFVDPFGATGAPFSAVSTILRSASSEVLINFDLDGVARIFRAGASANAIALLNSIYGDDSWKSVLTEQLPFRDLCLQALAVYKSRLRSLSGVNYVFSFEMRKSQQSLNYCLVFASRHPLGLEKMKEAMKKVDQTGAFQFSDARIGQTTLFRFDNPEDFSSLLLNQFAGRRVSIPDIRDFVLNETPFVTHTKILAVLERQGRITVASSDPKRRRYTFSEGKIRYIEFAKGN